MSQDFFQQGERKYTLFHVRPYKIKELASYYCINVRTFQRWLNRIREKIGKIEGQYLSITQVEAVIEHFKMPYFIKTEVVDEDTVESGKRRKQKPKNKTDL